jgi:hypothetical protein
MFGLNDPGVWSAYLLCIISTLFCIVYGMVNWNKGEDKVHPEDVTWVKDEKTAQDDL